MHSIVTTFRGAVIKVEVANFGAAIDTLIDQDALTSASPCDGHPTEIVTKVEIECEQDACI